MSETPSKMDFFTAVGEIEVPDGVESIFLYGAYNPNNDVDLVIVAELDARERILPELERVAGLYGVNLDNRFNYNSREGLLEAMKRQVEKRGKLNGLKTLGDWMSSDQPAFVELYGYIMSGVVEEANNTL